MIYCVLTLASADILQSAIPTLFRGSPVHANCRRAIGVASPAAGYQSHDRTLVHIGCRRATSQVLLIIAVGLRQDCCSVRVVMSKQSGPDLFTIQTGPGERRWVRAFSVPLRVEEAGNVASEWSKRSSPTAAAIDRIACSGAAHRHSCCAVPCTAWCATPDTTASPSVLFRHCTKAVARCEWHPDRHRQRSSAISRC